MRVNDGNSSHARIATDDYPLASVPCVPRDLKDSELTLASLPMEAFSLTLPRVVVNLGDTWCQAGTHSRRSTLAIKFCVKHTGSHLTFIFSYIRQRQQPSSRLPTALNEIQHKAITSLSSLLHLLNPSALDLFLAPSFRTVLRIRLPVADQTTPRPQEWQILAPRLFQQHRLITIDYSHILPPTDILSRKIVPGMHGQSLPDQCRVLGIVHAPNRPTIQTPDRSQPAS